MSTLARDHTEAKKPSEALPPVSVLMPIRNEVSFIALSLGAVLMQQYQAPLEVLVIDGMSDDGTRDIVAGIAKGNPQVRLLDNPHRIVSYALNIGVAHAQGEIFVRVDGRALLEPDYVECCVRLLQETGAANVGGTQIPIADTMQGQAVAAAMNSPFGVGTARFRFADSMQEVDTVYLGAWSRSHFEKVGGFDESLVRNQDYEFNHRLQLAGGKIIYSPDLRVKYYGRPTLKTLWRQYFDYGFWKARVISLHPGSTKLRHLVAPLFVMGLLFGALLSSVAIMLRWVYLVALAIYGLLVIIFSLLQAARHGWRSLLLLPIIFSNITYCLGQRVLERNLALVDYGAKAE